MASAKKKKSAPKRSKARRPNPCGEGRRPATVRGANGRKKQVCMVGGKTAIAKTVAAQTDLKPSQVKKVLDSVAALAEGEVKKGHPFVIPGIARIRIAFRKALPKRKGRNPFTGEEITIKARPASQVVRARPMKALKDAL